MIVNAILLLLALGWTINAAVFQARSGLSTSMWLNIVLAFAAGICFAVRVTPESQGVFW